MHRVRGVQRLIIGLCIGLIALPSPVRADAPPGEPFGEWSPAAPLMTARTQHSATLLPDGTVLVIGGILGTGVYGGVDDRTPPLTTTERYDPAADRWIAAAPLAAPFFSHSAVPLPDGRVFVAGRNVSTAFSVDLFALYNPKFDQWTGLQPLPTQAPSIGASVPLPYGQVLVLSCTPQRYDPTTGQWFATGPLSGCGVGAAASLPDGRVIVTGGPYRGGGYNDASLYGPATDAWARVAPMRQGRAWHTLTALPDGHVLAIGGADYGGTLASAEQYDPATDRWTPVAPMPFARAHHTATLLPDGRVLLAGGTGAYDGNRGNDPRPTTTALLYDPAADTWADAGSTYVTTGGHTATLLPDGRVLLAGGTGDMAAQYKATAATARYAP